MTIANLFNNFFKPTASKLVEKISTSKKMFQFLPRKKQEKYILHENNLNRGS